MTSKIIVVSTRPPSIPLSGGMAPAVKRACEEFDEVVWYAVGNSDSLQQTFETSSTAAATLEGRSTKEFDVAGMTVKQMMVDPSTWDSHYNKVSNSQLWPLCHDRFDLTQDVGMMDTFGARFLNNLMAEKIAHDLSESNDQTTPIWVHDYHHFALPAFLRKAGVKNPIVFFNHIPLPDPARIGERLSVEAHGSFRDTLKSLADCDAVNFQTAKTAARFMRYMGVEPKNLKAYEETGIEANGRQLRVGHYPISIDTAAIKEKSIGELESNSAKGVAEAMTAPNIFLNFERCDYSKGIEPRLLAFEKLLQNHPEYVGQVQIVIGAEPTRGDIDEYREYADKVSRIIDRINENKDWYHGDQPPVVLLPKQIPHGDVVKLMRNDRDDQRKIGIVTPYRDGMNLVAKEFVAAQRPDHAGPLILSSGAGSAAELTMGGNGAIVYDPDARELGGNGQGWVSPNTPDEGITSIYRAMLQSLHMPQVEANRRCDVMQKHLETYDIALWARKHEELLSDLSNGKPPSSDQAPKPDAPVPGLH